MSVTPAARVARGRRRRDEGNQRDVISDAPRCTFVRSARADAHAVLTVDLDIFPTLPRCFPACPLLRAKYRDLMQCVCVHLALCACSAATTTATPSRVHHCLCAHSTSALSLCNEMQFHTALPLREHTSITWMSTQPCHHRCCAARICHRLHPHQMFHHPRHSSFDQQAELPTKTFQTRLPAFFCSLFQRPVWPFLPQIPDPLLLCSLFFFWIVQGFSFQISARIRLSRWAVGTCPCGLRRWVGSES